MSTSLVGITHLALDLDGTLHRGRTLLPPTPAFLAALEELGIGRSFVTNNSSRNRAEHVAHLRGLGIDASPDEVFTSGQATIGLLASRYPLARRLFVLGTPALRDGFVEAGYQLCGDRPGDPPELVVVGFDTSLTYERLCSAAWWIDRGLPFVATHPDRICPTDEETVLVDCGSICTCLEAATGRKPDAVAGKPELTLLDAIRRRHGLEPHELGVVGDRLYTDVRMAKAAGAFSVLVLSGDSQRADLAASEDQPDLVVEDVGELERLLRE